MMLFSAVAGFAAKDKGKIKQEVDYVNPLIGTAFAGFNPGLEGGGTMPCVDPPFCHDKFCCPD